MDNPKNDAYFIRSILADLDFIVRHTKTIAPEELNSNPLLLDSMMFRLIQISENSKKLSDDFKQLHADIPWTAMFGLRNRIVHDYGSVDTTIIYKTLRNDIPELLEYMSTLE